MFRFRGTVRCACIFLIEIIEIIEIVANFHNAHIARKIHSVLSCTEIG